VDASSSTTTQSTTYSQINALSLSITTIGGPVLVMLTLTDFNLQNKDAANNRGGFVRIVRGSTELRVGTIDFYLPATGAAGDAVQLPLTLFVLDTGLAAGAYTYKAEWRIIGSIDGRAELANTIRGMQVTELKC